MSSARLTWRDEQTEQDEESDLREPAEPLGEGPGRRAVRQSRIGQYDRGQIRGEEPAGVDGARRRECHHAEPEGGERVEPRGG